MPKHAHAARKAEIDHEIAEAAEAENLLALDPDQAEKLYRLRSVKADLSKLRAEEAALSAEVKGFLKGYSGATVLGRLIATITPRLGNRKMDYDRFAIDHPKLYAKYVTRGATISVLHVHQR